MSRHVTYRGATLDMDSIRRENEKVPAIGNMQVNARGDQIKGGVITKTADQIARENHRVQSAVVTAGLKGPIPAAPTPVLEAPKAKAVTKTAPKETELPNGDIIVDKDTQ
jgi:hypothetical protein